jgi:hypothetical protein
MKQTFTDAQYDRLSQRPKTDIEIFCDMDGVLTDFEGHARAEGKTWPNGAIKWDTLDHQWWATMPAYPGMKAFYQSLKSFGNTSILTAPTLSPASFGGKSQWVLDTFDKFALKELCVVPAPYKMFLAQSNHILIDDRQKNIDEWVRAGGIGILHKGDYAETLKAVEAEIKAWRVRTRTPDANKPAP